MCSTWTAIRAALPNLLVQAARYLRSPAYRAACRVVRRMRTSHGMVVRAGPFVGLQYVREAVGSALAPKLVGTYEKEIQVAITEAIQPPCDGIVDIGSAEGYYAVGLATVTCDIPVVAFETTRRGRKLIGRMAAKNGVATRLRVEGHCDSDSLAHFLHAFAHPFIISDCEGAELELLDPARVPALCRANILVEVHGRIEVPKGVHLDHPSAMAELLRARFGLTHEIQTIPATARNASDWPKELSVCDVKEGDRILSMLEGRAGGTVWLWMVPMARRADSLEPSVVRKSVQGFSAVEVAASSNELPPA